VVAALAVAGVLVAVVPRGDGSRRA